MPGLGDQLREFARSGEFLSVVRKPALARLAVTNLGNFTGLTSTTWAAVDAANLAVGVQVSGRRPVRVTVGAMASGSSAPIALSVLWDGVEVTGVNAGIAQTIGTSQEQLNGVDYVVNPSRGAHRLALAYRMSGGTGTIYCDTNTRILLAAEELGSV